jgi:tripartite ATP-independent transporter DctM subunit
MTAASLESPVAPLIGREFRRVWTRAVDRAIALGVEAIAAVLLVVEVGILGAGVVWRYALHNPLSWSDELATILFLWLSMLGAVIAYQRDAHMRLTAVLNTLPPHLVRICESVTYGVVALFCIEVLPASQKFLQLEMVDLTPALAIPRAYVVAAILVGLLLILLLVALRLLDGDLRVGAAIAVCVFVAALAIERGTGALAPLGNVDLFIFFIVIVSICIAIGVPIAFSFGFATLSYLALSTTVPLSTVVARMDEGVSQIVLLAVPLFVLLGLLMESAGIAKRLVDALGSMVGHLRGGLGIVLIAAMYLVSGISGSKAADMAAVAPVLFDEMERRGQRRSEMVALLSSSAAMSETIPPSLVLIILGSVAGVSIGALFVAGLVPAALCAVALLFVVVLRSRNESASLAGRPSLGRIARLFLIALPGLLLPLLVRALVLGGVATASEVSVVGIAYTLIVGTLVYRELEWKRLYPILVDTAALSGAIMLIIATATAMAWALTQSGFAQQLADAMTHVPGGRTGFMIISIVLFVVLGAVLEGIPAIVLFGPLLFPIARQLGIDDVHYAIVAVLGMGVGLFAPPVGIGYFAACAIGKCSPDTAAPRIVPYLLALLAALCIIAAVPWLSTGFLHR